MARFTDRTRDRGERDHVPVLLFASRDLASSPRRSQESEDGSCQRVLCMFVLTGPISSQNSSFSATGSSSEAREPGDARTPAAGLITMNAQIGYMFEMQPGAREGRRVSRRFLSCELVRTRQSAPRRMGRLSCGDYVPFKSPPPSQGLDQGGYTIRMPCFTSRARPMHRKRGRHGHFLEL